MAYVREAGDVCFGRFGAGGGARRRTGVAKQAGFEGRDCESASASCVAPAPAPALPGHCGAETLWLTCLLSPGP